MQKFYTPTRFFALLGLFMLLMFNACKPVDPPIPPPPTAKDFDAQAMIAWNDVFLHIERYAPGFRPGPAPRAAAYIGLACYEACLNGMPEFKSIKNNYPQLNMTSPDANYPYHYPTLVNTIYSSLLTNFFASVKDTPHADVLKEIETLKNTLDQKYKGEVDVATFEKSQKYGELVAQEIWLFAKKDDVAHDHNLNPFEDRVGKYKQVYVAGKWVPTFPGPSKPMFPDWGYAMRFAISSDDRLCAPPIEYDEADTSQFYAQAREIYNVSKKMTADQRWLAFFWSDDLVNLTFSPGPRWLALENQALVATKSDLQTAIYANAKVGLAINDAAVACWFSKYTYNVERPESYIKRIINNNWEPLLYNPLTNATGVTPAFPAYPSGHSTMGAAAAEVLTDIFGLYVPLTDRCHEGRVDFEGAAPRSYNSFYEMAEENAYSRIPLGVHFRMDCEEGVNLGYRVGRKVNQLGWKK
ncbi:MAG: hypothetical protein RLZZ292_3017 [Bacteroidota bacterium]|jgi:membrane-associated phospholipid phosphatase